MRAKQAKVLDLLAAEGARYTIPLFQRSYAWDQSQCEDLLKDMMRAAEAGKPHFASTILYVPGNEHGTYDVVDGQQRLVTLSLAILALCRHLEASGERLLGFDSEDLMRTFVLTGGGCKLTLALNDFATFRALVSGDEIPSRPSPNVVNNFRYFADALSSGACSPELMWQGMRDLFCIAVELNENDRPQEVFESLNSKGAGLVTADMVRNFLLYSLGRTEQRRLYEERWEPMQALFGDDPGSIRLNNAILGWLSVRSPKNRAHRDKQAFRVFRQYYERDYEGSVEALLDELYSFCLVWAENYRYHAVKAFRSADWASIGSKTLVSDREKEAASDETLAYYAKHFGVDVKW